MIIYDADKKAFAVERTKKEQQKKREVSHRATYSLWAIERKEDILLLIGYDDIMKTRKASQRQRKTKSNRKTSDILLILNNYQYTSDSEDRFLDRQSNLIPLDLQTKA